MSTVDQFEVACVQYAPKWQLPEENRRWLADQFRDLNKVDLIVLPEMFASGFSLTEECIESTDGETLQWMKSQALALDAVLCGSVKTREKEQVFNRLYWVQPDGEVYHYDKVHMFGKEDTLISPGKTRRFVNYKGLRFMLQVCYDLRFPVFSRNDIDYDVLINIASWPKPRIHHWNALLKARAIENLSYVIGVNRVGDDGNNWQYVGESQVIAPDGELIKKADYDLTQIFYASISRSRLQELRKQFPFLQDRESFKLDLN